MRRKKKKTEKQKFPIHQLYVSYELRTHTLDTAEARAHLVVIFALSDYFGKTFRKRLNFPAKLLVQEISPFSTGIRSEKSSSKKRSIFFKNTLPNWCRVSTYIPKLVRIRSLFFVVLSFHANVLLPFLCVVSYIQCHYTASFESKYLWKLIKGSVAILHDPRGVIRAFGRPAKPAGVAFYRSGWPHLSHNRGDGGAVLEH